MSFMGVVSFLPLFMQVGQGVAATKSGLALLPMMGGLIFASTVTGFLVSKTGLYKPFMLGGAALLMTGVFLLTTIGPTTSLVGIGWRLLIVGLGLGPSQSLYSLAIQNAVPPHQIGVATSGSQFFRQIGSTIGVALFGALLTHDIGYELARRAPPDAAGVHQVVDIGTLPAMAMAQAAPPEVRAKSPPVPPAMLEATRQSFAVAIVNLFEVALAVLGLGVRDHAVHPGHPHAAARSRAHGARPRRPLRRPRPAARRQRKLYGSTSMVTRTEAGGLMRARQAARKPCRSTLRSARTRKRLRRRPRTRLCGASAGP